MTKGITGKMKKTKGLGLRLLVVVLIVLNFAAAAPAFQTRPSQPAPVAGQRSPTQGATPPVGAEQALYLVRSSLMTLNDANRSGNYTVVRDLASPDFQARNSAADLSIIFTDLRRRNLDLFAVALLNPTLDKAPALDANGRLKLAGYFPTKPLLIRFDLTFQLSNGQWKLYGISVSTPAAPGQQTPTTQPPPRR